MPTFYDDNDSQDDFLEPQLTRWRHRFRGQRESYKINTETNQFLYDVRLLYQRAADLTELLEGYIDLLVNGGEIEAGYNSATPIVVPGIEELASELDALLVRLRHLER